MTSPVSVGEQHYDALVVGAGFSGLKALHRLRADGFTAHALERARDVGGTWYWNRYPGARCDIESVDYCYSFDEELLHEWRWTERYATGPEILSYLQHVADRCDLRRDITFGVTVISARFDEQADRWIVQCDDGLQRTARFLIMATGNLSTPQPPDFEGLDEFEGRWMLTGNWPHDEVDLTGQRVAVVGTGSSGIQTITALAPVVDELYVLQRTPNYSMPARNRLLSDEEVAEVLATWQQRREACRSGDAGTPLPLPTVHALDVSDAERVAKYEEGWATGGISALSFAFSGMFSSEEANALAAEFARSKIRSIVTDPAVAEKLCPSHHIGTKRTCVDTGYFECYNRDNVHLIDLREEPIERITATGIATAQQQIDVEAIVFAIGFDAITGALAEIDIRGRNSTSLADAWIDGPQAYLGVQVAEFPNLFLITGPGSPSVLSNMVISIEQHVDWVVDAMVALRNDGLATIEATESAQAAWVRHVNALANDTLYPQANSWYTGTNIPGKPRVFSVYIGGVGAYRTICERVVSDGYRGFVRAGIANDEKGQS